VPAYLLFVLVFAGILVFYKFPYEKIESRLGVLVAERWGLKLDMADLRPALPPEFRFNDFSLRTLGYESLPVFHASEGYLRLRLLPLFAGKLVASLHAEAYGGSLNGEVTLQSLYDVRTYNLQAGWQAIQLERHHGLQLLLERQITGKLSGELDLDGPLDELANSSGTGTLRLTEGSCQIEHPYFAVRTLYGLEVSAALKLDSGEVEIDNCRFQAQGIKGTLGGIVQLQSRLYESVLNLGGQCQVDPALLNLAIGSNRGLVTFLDKNTPLPFRLRGTLAAPTLSLF
jgi:type II secretion system protein N